jgi:quinohemoprotein ethanol dehydrogenase
MRERLLALMLPLALAACNVTGAAGPQQVSGPGTGADWPGHGGGPDESGFSRLTEIGTGNVARLGLAWSLDLPGEVTLEATPIAVGGTLYFSGTYSAVYAVDGASGRLLWCYDPEIWKHKPARMKLNFAVNRGVAYDNGKIFVGAFDGRLIALDAKTGKELWATQTLPDDRPYFISGAPRTFAGKVIIGQGGGDFGSRGFVTAYDQASGKQLWRFHTVPGSPEENRGDPAMEMAAKTWGANEYWKTGTGGTVWNGITFDPELNRIYIGTGNSGPYDPEVRSPGGGDNLFLVSIVALDADSGKYVWHYQENPREAWDYKATMNIVMADLEIEGRPRKVLLHQPTNGFFYVIDRRTGKLLSAEKTGKVTWAERIDLTTGRPVERPAIRYENDETTIFPGPVGTHNWQAMAFSPRTGFTYIPHMQAGLRFSHGAPQPGDINLGGLNMGWVHEDPEDSTASLLAWDARTQKPAWKVRLDSFWNGGVLATAGGLVFQGTGDGWFSSYDAASGKRLWRFNAGHGIMAAPASFSAGGRQYVALLAGYGGSTSMGGDVMKMGWKHAHPRRLLAFALDGKAKLPPTPPPTLAVTPPDDSHVTISPADVAAGAPQFLACALCHGREGVSGGTAPDLRESAIAVDLESFSSVVHDGALRANGMPAYPELSPAQIRQLHAYVRDRSRAAR